MKIEEEIKQGKGFRNEFQKASINILFTSHWMNTINAKHFKPYQISPQQFNILRILKGQYPKAVSASVLTERMIDKNSNTSRLVDKLLKKELVVRIENKQDRRRVEILITEQGLRVVDEISEKLLKNDLLEKKLTEEEAKELSRILDKIREDD